MRLFLVFVCLLREVGGRDPVLGRQHAVLQPEVALRCRVDPVRARDVIGVRARTHLQLRHVQRLCVINADDERDVIVVERVTRKRRSEARPIADVMAHEQGLGVVRVEPGVEVAGNVDVVVTWRCSDRVTDARLVPRTLLATSAENVVGAERRLPLQQQLPLRHVREQSRVGRLAERRVRTCCGGGGRGDVTHPGRDCCGGRR